MGVDPSIVEVLETAVAADPDNLALRGHLATVLADAGILDRALVEAERVLAADPAHTDALAVAARAARASGDDATALMASSVCSPRCVAPPGPRRRPPRRHSLRYPPPRRRRASSVRSLIPVERPRSTPSWPRCSRTPVTIASTSSGRASTSPTSAG